MADQVTEVTSQSWFSRIGGAFKGVLFGLVMLLASFVLLFWNEGRAVKRHKALQEGSGLVVSVDAAKMDPAHEGALIHLSGEAATTETLSDPDFPVSENALRLRRAVEIYQWRESESRKTRKKLGGGSETVTTYSYNRGWSSNLEDSSRFKEPSGHENPTSIRFPASEETAREVSLGGYHLSEGDVRRIDRWEDVGVAEAAVLPEGARARDGGIYVGRNPDAPEVGDLRIRFGVVRPTTISLVGMQQGQTIGDYRTTNGDTIHVLEVGSHDAAAMFQSAESANQTLTWILRGVGFVVMFLAFLMMLSPLKVLADVVPFIGTIVGSGTALISFLVAAVFSLGTIAIAWIVYRPPVGIGLLVLMAGAGVMVIMTMRRSRRVVPATGS